MCSPTKEASGNNSLTLLNFLADRRYHAPPPKKAQISKQKVQYWGYELTPGHHILSTDRKKTMLDPGPPAMRKQLRTFLGAAGSSQFTLS